MFYGNDLPFFTSPRPHAKGSKSDHNEQNNLKDLDRRQWRRVATGRNTYHVEHAVEKHTRSRTDASRSLYRIRPATALFSVCKHAERWPSKTVAMQRDSTWVTFEQSLDERNQSHISPQPCSSLRDTTQAPRVNVWLS